MITFPKDFIQICQQKKNKKNILIWNYYRKIFYYCTIIIIVLLLVLVKQFHYNIKKNKKIYTENSNKNTMKIYYPKENICDIVEKKWLYITELKKNKI